jgi:hypothetical protein
LKFQSCAFVSDYYFFLHAWRQTSGFLRRLSCCNRQSRISGLRSAAPVIRSILIPLLTLLHVYNLLLVASIRDYTVSRRQFVARRNPDSLHPSPLITTALIQTASHPSPSKSIYLLIHRHLQSSFFVSSYSPLPFPNLCCTSTIRIRSRSQSVPFLRSYHIASFGRQLTYFPHSAPSYPAPHPFALLLLTPESEESAASEANSLVRTRSCHTDLNCLRRGAKLTIGVVTGVRGDCFKSGDF